MTILLTGDHPLIYLQACCNFPGDFSDGSDLFVLKFSSGTGGLLSGTFMSGGQVTMALILARC